MKMFKEKWAIPYIGDIILGDKNYAKHGHVVKELHAQNINYYENQWNNFVAQYDIKELEEELKLLREKLIQKATAPEHFTCIAEVVKATDEVKKKNGPKAMEFLKKAGKWTFDVATEIGTTVAAEVIKKAMGV